MYSDPPEFLGRSRSVTSPLGPPNSGAEVRFSYAPTEDPILIIAENSIDPSTIVIHKCVHAFVCVCRGTSVFHSFVPMSDEQGMIDDTFSLEGWHRDSYRF